MDYGGEGGAKGIPPPSKFLGGGGKGYVPPYKIIGGRLPPCPPLFLRLCVFRVRLSVCVFASFPYGFEGGVWDLIFIPDHCLSIYFD